MEPVLKFAQIPEKAGTDWNQTFEFGFVIIVDGRASCWGPHRIGGRACVETLGTKGMGTLPWGFTYKE